MYKKKFSDVTNTEIQYLNIKEKRRCKKQEN